MESCTRRISIPHHRWSASGCKQRILGTAKGLARDHHYLMHRSGGSRMESDGHKWYDPQTYVPPEVGHLLTDLLALSGANLTWWQDLGQRDFSDDLDTCAPRNGQAWIFALINAATYLAASLVCVFRIPVMAMADMLAEAVGSPTGSTKCSTGAGTPLAYPPSLSLQPVSDVVFANRDYSFWHVACSWASEWARKPQSYQSWQVCAPYTCSLLV